MRVTAAKDGVQGRRRLRIFAAAVALVLLCAVCVGGVSGAVFEVSTEQGLRNAVEQANINGEDDTIIITRSFTRSTNTPIDVRGEKLTILNKEGVDVTITIGRAWGASSLFRLDGSELILSTASSGRLTINGNGQVLAGAGGGAVYVTNGGSLSMNDGVTITEFGFLGGITEGYTQISYDGAAIYVESGSFVMNGGVISNCEADEGGAVYISAKGSCTINDGKIINNGHEGWYLFIGYHASQGGAVYVADGGTYVLKKPKSEVYSGNSGYHNNEVDYRDVRYHEAVTTVKYTVKHYLQNLDLKTYTLESTEQVEGTLGHDTSADAGNFPGFAAKEFSQEKVEQNTVVKIHYDRVATKIIWMVDSEVYHMYSDLYGLPVLSTPSNPTKTGYQFVGWDVPVPSTMPAEDLIVTALWEQGITFVITIPASLELVETGDKYVGDMTITAKEFWFPETDSLILGVSSKNAYYLQVPGYPETKLLYALTVDESSIPLTNENTKVAEFTMADYRNAGSSQLAVQLYAELKETPKYSGDYTDSLTFTVTYVGDGIRT